MATGNEQFRFPLQTQPQQPGKEYLMHPLPQAINPKYQPSNNIHGKVALVTGGDSGIGRSVCYHFALEGATVAFTYVEGIEDRDKDETLQMLLKAKSNDAKEPIAIATAVKFEENCKKVVDQVVSEFGQIDILVNNAAEQYYVTAMKRLPSLGLREFLEPIYFLNSSWPGKESKLYIKSVYESTMPPFCLVKQSCSSRLEIGTGVLV